MAVPTGEEIIHALAELRETIGKAHEARRDLAQTMKSQRSGIQAQIDREVTEKVDRIEAEIRRRMEAQVEVVIARIERDWRTALGLADR